VLASVIEGFETRFGDGVSVREVDCEGPSRQPRDYTKVRAILLSLVLFCPLLYRCTKNTHSDTALALTPLSLSLSLSVCDTPQTKIVATCLDARNVPTLPGIPPREVEAAWSHFKNMLVDLINDTRAADESMRTYVTDDGESGDWLAAASSASSRPATKSSSDIADEEIIL